MSTSLDALARLVSGQLSGDPLTQISGATTLAEAGPGDITLIDNADRINLLGESAATAAIVPIGSTPAPIPTIAVDDVHSAFRAVIIHFRPPREAPRGGIHPTAIVSPAARLADDVDVHAGATIGEDVEIGAGTTIHAGVHIMADCKIGAGVTIFPGVVIYDHTTIGPRAIIHAGAVIGAYGFGYAMVDGRHELSSQLGCVQIGADVEIGAGTTIDRGTYGATVIGEGTKIDNLVMIAHNCRLGRHNMICSQVGIAGSTTTGDYVVMAGQVGVRDHVHIGTQAVLGAMAGVTNNVPDGVSMIGIPATPERNQKLKQAALAKLPEMRKEFKAMKRLVAKLSAKLEDRDGQAAA